MLISQPASAAACILVQWDINSLFSAAPFDIQRQNPNVNVKHVYSTYFCADLYDARLFVAGI